METVVRMYFGDPRCSDAVLGAVGGRIPEGVNTDRYGHLCFQGLS